MAATKVYIEVRESFGNWLRDQIDRSGFTQSQVSKRIGISRTHLSRILAGDTGIRFETAISIADALSLSSDETLHRAGFSSGEFDVSLPVELIQFLKLPPEARDIIRKHIQALQEIYGTEDKDKNKRRPAKKADQAEMIRAVEQNKDKNKRRPATKSSSRR